MSQPCILLAGGDIVTRHSLAEYLRECGYKVIEASNAAEARQLLAGVAITISIAMIAVDLPDENGFSLSQWVRTTHSATKVLLSGTLTKTLQTVGRLCEEEPPIRKPYDHRLVLQRIRRLRATQDQNRT